MLGRQHERVGAQRKTSVKQVKKGVINGKRFRAELANCWGARGKGQRGDSRNCICVPLTKGTSPGGSDR